MERDGEVKGGTCSALYFRGYLKSPPQYLVLVELAGRKKFNSMILLLAIGMAPIAPLQESQGPGIDTYRQEGVEVQPMAIGEKLEEEGLGRRWRLSGRLRRRLRSLDFF